MVESQNPPGIMNLLQRDSVRLTLESSGNSAERYVHPLTGFGVISSGGSIDSAHVRRLNKSPQVTSPSYSSTSSRRVKSPFTSGTTSPQRDRISLDSRSALPAAIERKDGSRVTKLSSSALHTRRIQRGDLDLSTEELDILEECFIEFMTESSRLPTGIVLDMFNKLECIKFHPDAFREIELRKRKGYIEFRDVCEIFEKIKMRNSEEWINLLKIIPNTSLNLRGLHRIHDSVKKSHRILADSPLRWSADFLIVLSCIYYGVMIPVYDICHNTEYPPQSAGAASLVFTLLYVVDVFLKVNTAAFERGGLVERDKVAISYFTSPLCIVDFLSIVPLDIIFISYDDNKNFLISSHLRLLRLLTVPSLFAFSGTGFVTPRGLEMAYKFFPIVRLLVACVLVCHWFTCMFLIANCTNNCGIDYPSWNDYRDALYWVLYTVSSVGYGDVPVQTEEAQSVAMVLFVVTIIINGWLVGKMTSSMMALDTDNEHRELITKTLQVIQYFNMPADVVEDMLSLQNHLLSQKMCLKSYVDVVGRLPDPIQRTMSLYFRISYVDKIDIFKTVAGPCKVELATSLEREVRPRGDSIVVQGDPAGDVYFLIHGIAEVWKDGKYSCTLLRGSMFGESGLYLNSGIRAVTVRCRSYCEIMVLKKESVNEILRRRPMLQGHFTDAANPVHNFSDLKSVSQASFSSKAKERGELGSNSSVQFQRDLLASQQQLNNGISTFLRDGDSSFKF